MTVSDILAEIKERSKNQNVQNSVLLTKINNEYDQTNLGINNLNEDYHFTEVTLAVTASPGPYDLPADFGKFRALIPPSGAPFVDQVSPANETKPYGWYLSGTHIVSGVPRKMITFNADRPNEIGSYKLRYVSYPAHLDDTTNTVPMWPEVFHEILILGALKRMFSVLDLYEKFPTLASELTDLRASLLTQVGGLNLGANKDVESDEGWR